MSDEIVRHWDISTTHDFTAHRGDGLDMKTDGSAQANLTVDHSTSPFSDGSMSFPVNSNGTTKQVASGASGSYPIKVNGHSGWNLNVDTNLPLNDQVKKV